MQPANACRDVEDGGVGVRERGADAKQVRRDMIRLARGARLVEQLDGAPRPHGPLAEQAADDAPVGAVRAERERRHEVADDVVVVAV